ncbi:MAG: helix-turn-helix domain-containing protein, partial [Candidatus Eisenbacteria bacterium]
GNLRELRNVLERALLLSRDGVIASEDLQFQPRPLAAPGRRVTDGTESTPLRLEEVERRHILATLEAHNGNVQVASAVLGVPRSTLYQKLQRFGIRTHRHAPPQ